MGPASVTLKWDCNLRWVKAVSLGMREAIGSSTDRYIAQCAGAGDEGFREPAHVNLGHILNY